VSGVRVAPPVQRKIHMKKIRLYIQEAYSELVQKVSWPTWSDLQNSAIVVMIASLIIAIIVFAMDFSFEHIVRAVYKMFF
jgi:preprotein translocase subunit SecE